MGDKTRQRPPSRRQVEARIAKKRRRHEIAPVNCPGCGIDLRDKNVPPEYAKYAEMFTLALEQPLQPVRVLDGAVGVVWVCPACDHRWGAHRMPRESALMQWPALSDFLS